MHTTDSSQSDPNSLASAQDQTPKPPRDECHCNLCQKRTETEFLYRCCGEDIVRCRKCGLTFVRQQPSAATAIADIYSKDYFEGGVPDGYADYSSSEGTLREQAKRMLRRLRRYQGSGSLLEIGCAYGFFLLEAQKFFQVRGAEISAFASEQARRRGLDVATGDFQQLPYGREAFSAVCLFDCIEHLVDPFDYLSKVHDVLISNGIVALTTGDIGSLYARVSGQKWRLMTPPQHLFFFSKRTLTRMLQATGFEVLETSFPWKLVPWPLMLYQLSPRLKSVLGPLGRLPLGLYVNLFDAMFVIARRK